MPAARTEDLQVNVSRSVLVRAVYAVLGFAFLGLGIAGTFIPGLPGFINLLAALWFFSMSSERMYVWMLENKYFGQSLRDYKTGLGIPRRIKIVAVTAITVAVTLSVTLAITNIYARVGLIALGLYGIWFVATRPTREVEVARRTAAALVSPTSSDG